METTKLSTKGQVIIPRAFRVAKQWEAGQELTVIEVGDGILLRPKAPFEPSTLDEVAGCLTRAAPPKTGDEIDAALRQAARSMWRDGD